MIDFNEVWIFGPGLLGGSIAKCIKKRYNHIRVYGVFRNLKNKQKLVDYSCFDDYFSYDNIGIISGLAVICTPVDVIKTIFQLVKKNSDKNIIVTDTGSTKEKIVGQIKEIDPDNIFIGSHPMAGSENFGFEYSTEYLFENKTVVITPLDDTCGDKTNRLKTFWQALGAKTVILKPSEHDEITGMTSHTIHLLSALIMNFLIQNEKYDGKFLSVYGTGLLDTTRVAKSNVEMWIDIIKHNKDNILKNLKEIKNKLNFLIDSVNNFNLNELMQFLSEAKLFREKLDLG